MKQFHHIVISRTDSIGDVILTLPMAYVLKKIYPKAKISFLAKNYTKDVIQLSYDVDHFLSWDDYENDAQSFVNKLKESKVDLFIHAFPRKDIAYSVKRAKVATRLGTFSRLYHWFTCNRLVRLSRKNSKHHEAELNLKLLKPILEKDYTLEEITSFYHLKKVALSNRVAKYLHPNKIHIILHPLSQLSAREWGLENFKTLIPLIDQSKYQIIITGTAAEKKRMQEQLLEPFKDLITDTTGELSLKELIELITYSDILVAASTGPLHIAAMTGINAIGLYINKRPMHPGRWKPLGPKAEYLIYDEKDLSLDSIKKISPEKVLEIITQTKIDHP